jgi:hypothetical protein
MLLVALKVNVHLNSSIINDTTYLNIGVVGAFEFAITIDALPFVPVPLMNTYSTLNWSVASFGCA